MTIHRELIALQEQVTLARPASITCTATASTEGLSARLGKIADGRGIRAMFFSHDG
jgi:hypothetical protein